MCLEDLAILDDILRAVFPETGAEYFGGCSVILFGDIAQLPPMSGHKCVITSTIPDLKAQAQHGFQCFSCFSEVYELRHVFRIDHTDAMASRFNAMLSRIRHMSPTQDDIDFLSGLSPSPDINIPLLLGSTALCTTRFCASDYNFKAIQFLKSISSAPVYSVFTGMQEVLYAAIGARVVLLENINIPAGLYSGALGTIQAIIYAQSPQFSCHPECIVVQFDNFLGPSLHPTEPRFVPVFPIKPSSSLGIHNIFPLQLAFGMTVYKCHSLTMKKIVVHLGNRASMPGSLYVALSRVKRFGDVQIAYLAPSLCFADFANMFSKRLLLAELIRLQELSIATRAQHFSLDVLAELQMELQVLQDLMEQLEQ